uniref:Major facilitator superfamily (MFS) profile domain-containing protein n=2 Tax=Wuchereria bancrofti TaxID=6293 RepID=A0AAF5Q383_WUCBA
MSDEMAQISNSTAQQSHSSEKTYYFTRTEKGLLFSATAIGNLIGTYPVILLEEKLTIRKLFTLFGVISAISTSLIPCLANFGFEFLFAMRFLEGFAYASAYPTLGTITSQWSLLADSGMYMSLIMCHLQIGPLFTMPVSGALCVSSFGWPATYYIHGALTLFIIIIFYIIYRDSPKIHKNVSSKELSKIEFGKEVTYAKRMPKVPYSAIIRDISIWGVWIASIGGTLGFQIFFQYGPVYLNEVLNFTVEKAGLASALPMIFSIIVKVLAGPLSDHAACCGEKARVMLFTFISQGFMTACFIFLALIPTNSASLGQIAYTAAIAFSGLNCVGVIKSAQLVARQHTHFVLSILSIISCLIILIIPLFVSLIAPDNTTEQWSKIFYIIIVLMVVCNGFFFIVGKASPAQWTKVNNQQVYTINQPEMINAIITE